MDETTPDRQAGLAMLDTVLGDGVSGFFADATDPFMQDTAEHLFGAIWSRDGLSIRDRRLLTMGVIAAMGQGDAFTAHATGALRSGDLTAEQLHEVVLHLAYYAGASNGTVIRRGAADAIAKVETSTQ